MNKRNSLIDIIKIILAFLVVNLHFDSHTKMDFIIPFARIAVPLFFLLSGYFLGTKKDEPIKRAKNYIISNLKYLLFAFGIFFIYRVYEALRLGQGIESAISILQAPLNNIGSLLFYNDAPYGAWFLVALLIISTVHYLACKFNKTNWYLFFAVILLVCGLCMARLSLVLGISVSSRMVYRNAIFFGFPFFAIGFLIGHKKIQVKSWLKYVVLITGLLFACLQVVESKLFQPSNSEFFISTIPAAILILIAITSINISFNTKFLDVKLAFNIYITHIIIGEILSRHILMGNNAALSIFIVSLIVCEVYYLIKTVTKQIVKANKNKVLKRTA